MVRAASAAQVCADKGCGLSHYAKGFCKKHYTQWKTHGRLTPDRERGTPRVCKVSGCGRTDTINWHCRRHNRQLKIYGKLRPDREHAMGKTGCQISGCSQPHRAKGYCARHYNQRRWRMLQDGSVAQRARAGQKKKTKGKK